MNQLPKELFNTFLEYLREVYSVEALLTGKDPVCKFMVSGNFFCLWDGQQYELVGANKDLLSDIMKGFSRFLQESVKNSEIDGSVN